MQEIIKLWRSVSEIEGANWVIGVTGALILGWIGYYVVTLLRDMAVGNPDESVDLLSDFRELKQAGKLSEEEFKRVQASTPLPGEVQAVLERPEPSLDPIPGGQPPDLPEVLPPARKLTPEEAAAIRQKLAERTGQGRESENGEND
jgi:hypothetical protein